MAREAWRASFREGLVTGSIAENVSMVLWKLRAAWAPPGFTRMVPWAHQAPSRLLWVEIHHLGETYPRKLRPGGSFHPGRAD